MLSPEKLRFFFLLYPPNFLIGHIVLSVTCLRFRIFLTRNFTDITDVCMDETAVSSDPVIAFLLDEVVVKDWCKRTFKNIIAELQGICILKPCFFVDI